MQTLLILVIVVAGAVISFGLYERSDERSDATDEEKHVDQQIDDLDAGTYTDKLDAADLAREVVDQLSNVVDMSNQGLTKVSMNIFEKENTVTLNVSHNMLSGSLPAEVRHLKNLVTLDLSHNNFTGVPAEIGQLQQLEVLNLSHNPISGLPIELGNLKNLRILNLEETNYSEYDLEIIQKSLPDDVEIRI